jgi:DNA-directed RNA polymerase specialized sigma24 family protein
MTEVDTADVLERAAHYDRDAVGAILEAYVPMVHRMACGLSGREDVAVGVERFVVKQGLRLLPKWQQRDGAAGRWFAHHTVLTARRAERYAPDAATDVLVRFGEAGRPSYVAFVRAIRTLERQQGEAWLLMHAEGFDIRATAVAMDCSIEAAKNHLLAAEYALRGIGAGEYEALTAGVRGAYQKLTPAREWVAPQAQKYVRRLLWPRRMKRVGVAVVMVCVLGGLVYAWRRGWLGLIPGL